MLRFFNYRMLIAWILSIAVTFFAIGFLGNFYFTFFEILLLTILTQSLTGLWIYRLLGKAKNLRSSQPFGFAVALALFLALTVFVAGMFRMAMQFPRLFGAGYFILKNGQLIPFIIGSVLVIPCLAWARRFVKQGNIKQMPAYLFMNELATGSLVAGFFFSVYLVLVSIFNRPAFDTDDIFFDSDGLLWRWRFVTEHYRDYYWRPVHPFVLLIIRPLVAFFSFFLKGDRLAAAFVLVAFTGALSVFLVWYFVKHTVGNPLYALLIASLFGASTAQLVFSSLIETYVFLAAIALIFLVLLLKDKPLFVLVIAGLVTFGITISNFAQTVIAHLLIKRDIKQWIIYGLIIAALVVPLNLLNGFVYPNSQPYFFDLAAYNGEGHNTFPPTVQRGMLLGRVMFLHSIVAPDPLILKEEIPFLKVWMFRAAIKRTPMRIAVYDTWFGTSIAYVWLAFVLLGGVLFLKNFRGQDSRFFFTFILILLFYFIVSMQYGKDVFLYSANWTYAIILFLALAWRELANKRWFQIFLLVFIALLMANNSRLIFTMLTTSALHLK
jgi:hypothetical protein